MYIRAVDLAPETEDRVPEIRQIIGLRNRVIHGYDAVDDGPRDYMDA